MAVILIVVLGFAVVVSAVAAERSARARHRLRAVCLNLFGIACLGLGLLCLYGWCRGGVVVVRQVAMASAQANPGTVIELLLDDNAPLDPSPLPDPPTAPGIDAVQGDGVDEVPATAESAAEVTGEAPDQPASAGGDPVVELPDGMDAQVQIDYAARPAWVDREDRDEGPLHLVCATAGPYASANEATRELDIELKRLTDEHINDVLGSTTAARWIAYDLDRIKRSLVATTNYYNEKVISPSVGVMHQSHALLEFGPEFHRDVERTWQQIVARARLVKVALAAAALLGTLALLFSYFQADTATRGFYTGRLKFVTFVAILGLIVSGLFLARSIPWLWP